MKHIEVILPVYNEVNTLPKLVSELDEVGRTLGAVRLHYLFVNDGSTDGSTEWLRELAQSRDDVRVVELIRNYGHAAALAAGIDHFDADAAIFMDADMQDSPAAIATFVKGWQEGAKTVVAERGSRTEANRYLFRAFYWLLHHVAKSLPPIDFGTFCLLDRTVVERLRALGERNRYFPGLVAYSSGPISSVRVNRESRAHGQSRVGFWGLVNLALTALLSFSNAPIRLVSVFGILASLAALLSGSAIVAIKLFTDKAIPGWASIMTATSLVGGVQLLCLGLIGEYIARIYDEVKSRPPYFAASPKERKASRKAA